MLVIQKTILVSKKTFLILFGSCKQGYGPETLFWNQKSPAKLSYLFLFKINI